MALSAQFDVVIIDYFLTVFNGLEVIRRYLVIALVSGLFRIPPLENPVLHEYDTIPEKLAAVRPSLEQANRHGKVR